MKSGFLDNMAPNSQRAFVLTLVLAAVAVAIYMFAVVPAQDSLSKSQSALDDAENEKTRIDMTLRNSADETKRLSEAKERLKDYSAKFIERRLGSYATHAREILDPLAIGAGLTDIDYPETSVRKLPLPNPKNVKSPKKLHERVAVRMTASGSYQSAISFLLRAEAELPLVSVQAMRISKDSRDVRRQHIDITFEWPSEGPVDNPPNPKEKRP